MADEEDDEDDDGGGGGGGGGEAAAEVLSAPATSPPSPSRRGSGTLPPDRTRVLEGLKLTGGSRPRAAESAS
jgi:hypothetical protein